MKELHRMFTRIATILTIGFLLAIVSPIALAQAPILLLDANLDDDPGDGWTNEGSAGGIVPTGDGKPDWERDAGPGGTAAYTSTACGHNFSSGDDGLDGRPELFVASWSLEVVVKQNGTAVDVAEGGGEHHLIGFFDQGWPPSQWIGYRFELGADNINLGSSELRLTLAAARSGGVDNNQHFFPVAELPFGEWATLTATFNNDDGSVKHYVDGVEHSEFETIQDFDNTVAFDMIGIFLIPGDNACRGFGGSIATVKMWDRVIGADEIGGTAVEVGSKLATTWSRLKSE
jgi:hypothetical protein